MCITLKPDGFWVKNWIFNEKSKEGCYKTTKINNGIFDLFQYLWFEIELEGEITLKTLIEAFNSKDLVVLGLLTGCNIDNFVHELSTNIGKDKEDLLNKVKIEKYYQIQDLRPYDGDLIIEDNCCASGLKDSNPEENYSLGFTNWWHLKDIPIIISKKAVLCDDRKAYSKNRFIKSYKPEKFNTSITLLEFLRAIFNELAWHNSPKDRDETMKDLITRKEEIDNGTAKLIPWEDIKEKCMERINENNKDNKSS